MHYSRSPEKSRLGFKMCFYLFSLCLFQEAVLDHSREILEKSPLFILVPPRTLNRLFRTFFIMLVSNHTQNRSYTRLLWSVLTCADSEAGRWTSQTRYSLLDNPIFLTPERLSCVILLNQTNKDSVLPKPITFVRCRSAMLVWVQMPFLRFLLTTCLGNIFTLNIATGETSPAITL